MTGKSRPRVSAHGVLKKESINLRMILPFSCVVAQGFQEAESFLG
jgi:hypothetical protein